MQGSVNGSQTDRRNQSARLSNWFMSMARRLSRKSRFFSLGLTLLYSGSSKYLLKKVSSRAHSRCFHVFCFPPGRHVARCTSIVFTPCKFPNAWLALFTADAAGLPAPFFVVPL